MDTWNLTSGTAFSRDEQHKNILRTALSNDCRLDALYLMQAYLGPEAIGYRVRVTWPKDKTQYSWLRNGFLKQSDFDGIIVFTVKDAFAYYFGA